MKFWEFFARLFGKRQAHLEAENTAAAQLAPAMQGLNDEFVTLNFKLLELRDSLTTLRDALKSLEEANRRRAEAQGVTQISRLDLN